MKLSHFSEVKFGNLYIFNAQSECEATGFFRYDKTVCLCIDKSVGQLGGRYFLMSDGKIIKAYFDEITHFYEKDREESS